MKVTVWIDWDHQIFCSSKKELAEDFENSDCSCNFEGWLDDHYAASEVWNIDADEKTAIKQEYHRYYDTCLEEFIDTYYEAIEIEV